jgi:hypothetical protein
MTAMTNHLLLPAPTGSLTGKNMRFQKPVVGTNAMASYITHHIALMMMAVSRMLE